METYFKRLGNNNSLHQENKRYAFGDHLNDDFTLKFVFSGSKLYKINRRSLVVHPDCFLAINKNTSFESKVQSDQCVQSLSISFAPDFIKDMQGTLIKSTAYLLDNLMEGDAGDLRFPETLLPLKSNLNFNLKHIRRYVRDCLRDDSLLEEYLHHTFINYFEIINSDVVLAGDRLKCLKKNTKIEVIKRLNIAKDFMYCNYNQQITLTQIAENSCLSVNHLLRTFKQVFGETPYQFLTKLRLRRANYLIKNSLYPINEIVALVGFECASSFIRLYKSYFSHTPGKFRSYDYQIA
ncbi:AraC family transcriptional regulator [Pedobacter frigiditerrae]|uniref:AraC family transcriptional regulator n=1 Tax=Pedobacter frigiditerrae TaxID=2530452 RepID=A0A4R0MTH6_9SPHI|nr:helix-turn-helix transcriptional regulator [Pedobacter frigiditerrae]TCC90093.1 AraC family transcriptional regulator [Pedobacter frigiditerrae]